MTPETDTLTLLLETFLEAFRLGRVAVGGQAWSLLSILVALELSIAGLFWALRGADVAVVLVKKILSIGFFIFVVTRWDYLIESVIDGFIYTGSIAAQGAGGNMVSIRNPSAIIDVGFNTVANLFQHLIDSSSFSDIFSPGDIVFTTLGLLIILGAYIVMAIQVFVVRLEFGLIATLSLILVPFGVLKQTSFLAEKVFSAVISFGVRLMVLSFIISVTIPVISNYQLPEDPTWPQIFTMIGISLSVMTLALHAPGVAAGLLVGQPNLSAQTLTQSTRNVVAAGFAPIRAIRRGK